MLVRRRSTTTMVWLVVHSSKCIPKKKILMIDDNSWIMVNPKRALGVGSSSTPGSWLVTSPWNCSCWSWPIQVLKERCDFQDPLPKYSRDRDDIGPWCYLIMVVTAITLATHYGRYLWSISVYGSWLWQTMAIVDSCYQLIASKMGRRRSSDAPSFDVYSLVLQCCVAVIPCSATLLQKCTLQSFFQSSRTGSKHYL